MNSEQQRKLDSLIRVQDFLAKNATVVGPVATSAAKKQIDDAVSQIRQHITAQEATQKVTEGQSAKILGMSKNLVRSHVSPIAKFARATLRGTPEYTTLAGTPRPGAPKKVVTHGYALAKAAAPYASAMVAAGFPSDTLDQLTAATNELNDAIVKREPLAASRVQSTVTVDKLIELGRDGVRKIDAVLAKRLVSDQPMLSSWQSASRVQDKVGRVRKPALDQSVTIKPPTSANDTTTPPSTK